MQAWIVGARMTGGGFGGCTVNLVAEDTAETFVKSTAVEYETRTGIKPEIYVCTAVDGVKRADGADNFVKEGSV